MMHEANLGKKIPLGKSTGLTSFLKNSWAAVVLWCTGNSSLNQNEMTLFSIFTPLCRAAAVAVPPHYAAPPRHKIVGKSHALFLSLNYHVS